MSGRPPSPFQPDRDLPWGGGEREGLEFHRLGSFVFIYLFCCPSAKADGDGGGRETKRTKPLLAVPDGRPNRS